MREMKYIPNGFMLDAIQESDFFKRTASEEDQKAIKLLLSLASEGVMSSYLGCMLSTCWMPHCTCGPYHALVYHASFRCAQFGCCALLW
jgi:hypothetical protein